MCVVRFLRVMSLTAYTGCQVTRLVTHRGYALPITNTIFVDLLYKCLENSSCFIHLLLLNNLFRLLWTGLELPLSSEGRGYSLYIFLGGGGVRHKTLSLFQNKICDFPYPILDPSQNSMPYFRPLKCSNIYERHQKWLWFHLRKGTNIFANVEPEKKI